MQAAEETGPAREQALRRILVVDDQSVVLEVLQEVLEYEGFHVDTCDHAQLAIERLAAEPYDVLVTDLKMPGMDGIELISNVRELDLKPIVMTGFGTVETAVEAMKQGAFDFVLKPFKPEDVVRVVRRALEALRLERENMALKETVGFYELSEALSSAMPLDQQLAMIVEMVAKNLGAESVSIVTADATGDESLERARVGSKTALTPEMARRLLAAGRDSVLANGQQISDLVGNAAANIESVMATTLRVRGRPFGVLTATSMKKGHRFTEGQRKGLAVLGGRAANAIETDRMFHDLKSTFTQTIEGLMRALEAKDAYTAGHSDRVAMYARLIAHTMGLDEAAQQRVYHGGLLHDIGKIGVDLSVINKPGKLTPDEYEMFKSHTVLGRRIVEPISFLNHLIPFIYCHHESWNGRGYPEGLAADAIPFDGRLMAVADSYDAMTSNRPYRKALPHDIAMAELRRCSGTQFDKEYAQAFCDSIEDFRQERRDRDLWVPE